jgi:hypothetical protein
VIDARVKLPMTAVIVGLLKATAPNHSAYCCLAVHASGGFLINGDFIFFSNAIHDRVRSQNSPRFQRASSVWH